VLFKILKHPDRDILSHVEERRQVRAQIISDILNTDNTRHFELLKNFQMSFKSLEQQPPLSTLALLFFSTRRGERGVGADRHHHALR